MRGLKHWVKLLRQSEVEQMELPGEGQSGVIRLEDLIRGKQQIRFQSIGLLDLWLFRYVSAVVASARWIVDRIKPEP